MQNIGRVAVFLACTGCLGDPTGSPPQTIDTPTPAPGTRQYALQDVSVLMPISTATLTLASPGNGGALLDRAALGDTAYAYEDWRVVAARIDPCDPSACRPQLRLTAQPRAGAGFADAALELSYDLSPDQFAELGQRWLALATPTVQGPNQPLELNTKLLCDATAASYGDAIRGLILAYAGPATLGEVSTDAAACAAISSDAMGRYNRKLSSVATSTQRAFGYVGTQPAWSQCLVDDSARVAQYFSAQLPR